MFSSMKATKYKDLKGNTIHSDNAIVGRSYMHGSGTVVKEYPKTKSCKSMCGGFAGMFTLDVRLMWRYALYEMQRRNLTNRWPEMDTALRWTGDALLLFIAIIALLIAVSLSCGLGYSFYREVIRADMPCGSIMGTPSNPLRYCDGRLFPSRNHK